MSLSDVWSYEFMRYAILSAMILGPLCALLGVFVTLRGMAFFSDALAHSAIAGVALGFLMEEKFGLQMDPMLVVLAFSLLLAGAMAWLSRNGTLAPDTVIAFSFTGCVAFGVIVISMLGNYRLLDGILFGSIYANGPQDLLRQGTLALVAGGFLISQMRSYTLMTLSPELAHAQRVKSAILHYLFALLVAATVVVCLKMLGALLLSALIVIPAAAAKLLSGNFRTLLVTSMIVGLFAPLLGVWTSIQLDLPSGPAIVMCNVLVLLCCYMIRPFASRLALS